MSCLPEKARWRIAHLLEYRPGWCWTSLVLWALARDESRLRNARIDWICREDVARVGFCYCGKLRREKADR